MVAPNSAKSPPGGIGTQIGSSIDVKFIEEKWFKAAYEVVQIRK